MQTSGASGTFLSRIVRRPIFPWMIGATILYVVLAAIGFYLAEGNTNPKVMSVGDALLWVASSIPFVGRLSAEPVTFAGTIVAIVSHMIGFLLFCLWIAVLGVAFFGEKKS